MKRLTITFMDQDRKFLDRLSYRLGPKDLNDQQLEALDGVGEPEWTHDLTSAETRAQIARDVEDVLTFIARIY